MVKVAIPAALVGVAVAIGGVFLFKQSQVHNREQQWAVVQKYCFDCHNRDDMAGGRAFDKMSPEHIGADAETSWLPHEIARDRKGYVLTGADALKTGLWAADRDPYLLETTVPGIFACGDVRQSPVKRVAAAVGEGSMSIAFVHQFLKELAGGRG